MNELEMKHQGTRATSTRARLLNTLPALLDARTRTTRGIDTLRALVS
jgi:hypothetical protein